MEADERYGKDVKPELKQSWPGRKPWQNIKPLAQHLAEYIEHEAEVCNIDYHALDLFAYNSWRELLEHALNAYESTENVKIKIEKQ